MSKSLQKIWGFVIHNLPQEDFYNTLEVHYYSESCNLCEGIFYTKKDLSGRLVDDYLTLKESEVIDISLAVHSIQYYCGKPIYTAFSKNSEKFAIYEIDKFYLYARNGALGEISITPYPEQIIHWAEEWRETLNPKEEIGLSLINTIIEQIKRSKH